MVQVSVLNFYTCMYSVFTTGERMVHDGPHGESMTSDSQHEQGKH